jgi:NTP pyrophosphatase (non-canonical NTP hydrolase)
MTGTPEPPKSRVPDLAIGSDVWPGLAKLAEECGELAQVIGKLTAYPDSPHPDGSDLVARLQEEMADVQAAIEFVCIVNLPINGKAVSDRHGRKLRRFRDWHRAEQERT